MSSEVILWIYISGATLSFLGAINNDDICLRQGISRVLLWPIYLVAALILGIKDDFFDGGAF